MNEFEPKVNNVSLFREIANNIVNPLEVVREAISIHMMLNQKRFL